MYCFFVVPALKIRLVVPFICFMVLLFSTSTFVVADELKEPQSSVLKLTPLESFIRGDQQEAKVFTNPGANYQTLPKSTAASELTASLSVLVSTLDKTLQWSEKDLFEQVEYLWDFKNSNLTFVENAFYQFEAQHLLYLGRLDKTLAKLEKNGASESVKQRALAYKASYLKTAKALLDPLSSLLLRDSDAEFFALYSNSSEVYDLASSVDTLTKLISNGDTPILRATTLPVRDSVVSAGTPDLSTTIQPSYLQGSFPSVETEDLVENGDVNFSEKVLALAKSLSYDPVKIYNHVRNTVSNEYYFGAMQGAENTLLKEAGNSTDQSSLLISLLRASGIPSRYVHGVIELPVEAFQLQLGIQDPTEISKAIRAAGIPSSAIIRGGRIAAIQLEHTWVSAFVPYANYRGVSVDASGKTWLPLFPAVKGVTYRPAGQLLSDSQIDLGALADNYFTAIQTNSITTQITQNLQSYIAEAGGTEKLDTHLSEVVITEVESGYLPNSAPAAVVGVLSEQAQLADELRHWVTFKVYQGQSNTDASLIEKRVPLSSLDDQRVTLSYLPGSAESQNVVHSFGGLGSTPAYLIDLRPQIKVNGVVIATGTHALPMGNDHLIELVIKGPGYEERIKKHIVAGSYHAAAISAQKVQNEGDSAESDADTEYDAARILSQLARRYLHAWDNSDELLANLAHRKIIRPVPSVTFVSNDVEIVRVFDLPQQLNWQGVTLDAALRNVRTFSKTENSLASANWMELSALEGSYWEHRLLEQSFNVNSVSADKVIATAVETGQTVLSLNSGNIESQLPSLNHSDAVLADIAQWVSLGYQVTVPIGPIQVDAWTGSGWRVKDSVTGGAGYFLSGGIAGGNSAVIPTNWPEDIANALAQPYEGRINLDALAAESVYLVPATDNQWSTVNTQIEEPLRVIVEDKDGARVHNAQVTFTITAGGGLFGSNDPESGTLTTVAHTDSLGIARIEDFYYPKSTLGNHSYALLDDEGEAQQHYTRVSKILIDIAVNVEDGEIRPLEPFTLFATPGEPARIFNNATGFEVRDTRYPASLEWRMAHPFSVVVVDAFDNPISNLGIEVSTLTPELAAGYVHPSSTVTDPMLFIDYDIYNLRHEACDQTAVSLRTCGSANIVLSSNAEGAAIIPLVGRSTDGGYTFPVLIASGGISQILDIPASQPEPGELQVFYSSPSTVYGSIDYVEVSKVSRDRLITVYWQPSEGAPNLTLEAVKTGVDFYIADALSLDPYVVSPENYSSLDGETQAEILNFDIQHGDGISRITYDFLASSAVGGSVINLLQGGTKHSDYSGPKHIDLKFIDPGPIPVELSSISDQSGGSVREGFEIGFSVKPWSTVEQFADIIVEQEGQLFYFNSGIFDPTLPPESTYEGGAIPPNFWQSPRKVSTFLPRGIGFDFTKEYLASGHFFFGTEQHIESDKVELEFDVDTIIDYVGSFELYTEDVEQFGYGALDFRNPFVYSFIHSDIANETTCSGAGAIRFSLTRDVNITIEVYNGESSTVVETLESSTSYPRGTHHVVVPVLDLGVGFFTYKIIAEDPAGERATEERMGAISIASRIVNSLPLAHANYENVDLFDGSLSISRSDIQLPGRGVPISLNRTYSSTSKSVGRMGMGWNHSYDSKIMRSACGGLTVAGGEGGGQTFTKENGQWVPQKGYHGALVETLDGYDFFSKSGNRYHYAKYNFGPRKTWYLETITDANGNVTKLAYDPAANRHAKLTAVENGLHKLHFTYQDYQNPVFLDQQGPIVSRSYVCVPGQNCNPEAEPANVLIDVSYGYDEQGRLTAATYTGYPTQPLPTTGLNTRTENYTYKITSQSEYFDDSGITNLDARTERAAIHQIIDFRSKPTTYDTEVNTVPINHLGTESIERISSVAKITKPEGGEITFDYRGLDTRQSISTVVNGPREGAQTTYYMNRYGAPERIVSPAGTKEILWDFTDDIEMRSMIDENGVQTIYAYDDAGNTISEKIGGVPNAEIVSRYWPTFGSSIKNRLQFRIDRNGEKTSYVYDSRGNLEVIEYPAVQVKTSKEEYLPDGLHIPVGTFTEHFGYDSNGDKLVSIDKNGNYTRYTYDDYGNVKAKINADVKTTNQTWNALGLKTHVRDARSSHENDNRYLTEYFYDGLNNLIYIQNPIAQGQPSHKTFTYDQNGNKLTETDEEGKTTTWTYYDENRVWTETNADEKTRTFTYDEAGNLKTETSFREGSLTTYGYDLANRLTNITGPENRTITQSYDGVGNLKTAYVTSDRVTTHHYDSYNRKERTEISGGPALVTTYYQYDHNGNLRTQIDAELNETRYEYDELNRRVNQIEEEGRSLGFAYDKNGNLIAEIDGNNGVLTRKYSVLNRVEEEADAYLNAHKSGVTPIYPRTFHYDAVGNLLSQTDRRGYLTTHTYDPLNRQLSTTIKGYVEGEEQDIKSAYTHYKIGSLKSELLPNGNLVEYVYDDLHRLTLKKDLLGNIESRTYDNDGNPNTATNAEGHTTTYNYDLLNRLKTETLHDKRYTENAYDVYGNVERTRDYAGNEREYDYDFLNRLWRAYDPAPFEQQYEEYTYDKVGNRTVVKDRLENTTYYAYDDLNRLREITYPEVPDAEGNPTSYTEVFGYDHNNNQNSATNRRGVETVTYYDENNRVERIEKQAIPILRERSYDGENNVILETDAEENTSSFYYDPRGLQIRASHPHAAITHFKYDTLGNRVYVQNPEGVETKSGYGLRNWLDYQDHVNSDGEMVRTNYTYYDDGQLWEKTTPEGGEWTYTYDTTNRLETIGTNATVGNTAYTYHDNNTLETQTDGEGNITTFFYDELNRRTQITYDEDDATVTYDLYDANGNLKDMTDANGQTTQFNYDNLNREILRTYARVASALNGQVETVATTYDNNNNITDVVETYDTLGTKTYQWGYDGFDRNDLYTDAFGKTTEYRYDNNGNRLRIIDPDKVVTVYSYDDLNRVNTVTNSSGITHYDYYRDSQIKKVTYPASITSGYRYNPSGRVSSIENKQNNALVSRFEYRYDNNGNRTQQIETNGGDAETTAYGYDLIDRLERVEYPDITATYGYDDSYNRTSEEHVLNNDGTPQLDRTYNYNGRNQLTDIADNLDAGQSIVYGYDLAGNQITKTKAGETTEFIYDARHNLRKVQVGGSSVGQFLYDAQSLRTEKIGDRGTERYTYDDQSVLLQYNETNTTQAKYEYGPNRLLSLSHTTEGTQFYLTDALNSVVNLANENGAIQARYQYDAWGNKRNEVGSSWNRFAFTGYEEDTESGLLYAKARFYDPDTGRFLSHDPWEGDVNTPPSLHRYLYAYGNPTVWVDLTGEAPFLAELTQRFADASDSAMSHALEMRQYQGGVLGHTVATFSELGAKGLSLLGAGSGMANLSADAAISGVATNLEYFGAEFSEYGVVSDSRHNLSQTKQSLIAIGQGIKTLATSRDARAELGIAAYEGAVSTAQGVSRGDAKAWQNLNSAWGGSGIDALAGGPLKPFLRMGPTVAEAGKTGLKIAKEASGAVGTQLKKLKENLNAPSNPMIKQMGAAGDLNKAARDRAAGVTKSRGYDRPEVETKSGKAVKQKNATDEWDNFLGDKQTNIDPRDGLPDPDRIWSADGKRSIRFGEHEMNSKPNKLHYHQETWHDDKVENVLQRIPQ